MEDHPLKVENVTVKTGTCTVIIRVVFHDNYLGGGGQVRNYGITFTLSCMMFDNQWIKSLCDNLFYFHIK